MHDSFDSNGDIYRSGVVALDDNANGFIDRTPRYFTDISEHEIGCPQHDPAAHVSTYGERALGVNVTEYVSKFLA